MKAEDKSMERIVALCNDRGFVFQGSEIYGGLANSWDYGPVGCELKRNVKEAWWQSFVVNHHLNTGIDAAILMNPAVWDASGHIAGFSDPLIDCKKCRARFRADQLIEDYLKAEGGDGLIDGKSVDSLTYDQMSDYIAENKISCPKCGAADFTEVRKFNLMFKTYLGVTEDSKDEIYLRPETAQGIFVNFRNVQRSTRKKLPFGICQIGKSFRNEITPGNFIFRTREFEQMELEFFCEPGTDLEWFDYWRDFCGEWLKKCGLSEENLRIRDHSKEELSHYSVATSDYEYKYPKGWGELWGIADRTDYDLKQHMEHAKTDLRYYDHVREEKYLPYVVEPSIGVDRMVLALICEAYDEEELEDGSSRVLMRFKPSMAPIKIAILPLSAKLSDEAGTIFAELSRKYTCQFDDRQSIGKRYRRQDEIGTPYCVTYDFESREDRMVTVRERDSMVQERVKIDELNDYFKDKFDFV